MISTCEWRPPVCSLWTGVLYGEINLCIEITYLLFIVKPVYNDHLCSLWTGVLNLKGKVNMHVDKGPFAFYGQGSCIPGEPVFKDRLCFLTDRYIV